MTEYKMLETIEFGDDVYEDGETYYNLPDDFLEEFEGSYEVIEVESAPQGNIFG